jgi:hypothetical protein
MEAFSHPRTARAAGTLLDCQYEASSAMPGNQFREAVQDLGLENFGGKNRLHFARSRRILGYWSEAIAVGDADWLNEEAGNMGVKKFKIFTVNNDQCFIGKS